MERIAVAESRPAHDALGDAPDAGTSIAGLPTNDVNPVDSIAASRDLRMIRKLEQEVNELCRRQGALARYPDEIAQIPEAAKAEAPDQPRDEGGVPLESILCTEELHRRAPRPPDHATENRALLALAQALADSPNTILQTLVEKILEVLQAGSAGISVLTKDEKRFFRPAVAGAWKAHVGEGAPRDFGPCGDVLDCNRPLLFKHFERRYPYLLAATPPAEECLLVPFYAQGKALGTIWAIHHDDRRKFDAEDLRQLESLGSFASAAYQAVEAWQGAFAQRSAALDLLQNAERSRDAMKTLNLELRASEERYRTILESMGEGFFIVEKIEGEAEAPLDFRVIVANAAFEAQSGMGGAIGKTIRKLVPQQADEWNATCDIVCKTGQPIRFECRLDATGYTLELLASRIEDETHRRVAIMFRNITERKRAEELLRLNRDTFFNLIQNSPFGLYVMDAQLCMKQVSTASEKVFCNVIPLIGRSIEQVMLTIWPEDFARDVIRRFRHTLETGEPYRAANTTEQRQDIPDTESYDWKIERITLPDGQFGVVCYFYDITERKEAEEALRASEEFNRSIIESSPDCIKILDFDGNLLAMLGCGQELLGIEDIQTVLNTSWLDLWGAEDRPSAQAAVEVAVAGGKGNFVGFFRTLRAEAKWWDVAISPILDANNKPARLLAVSRDVTRRKQAELNLEFLASVSQDLLRWTGVDEMMQTVGTKMAAYLGLSICAFVEIDDAADQVVISHDWHREDVPSLVGVHRLADFVEGEFIQAARAGTTIVVRDTATDPRTGPEKFAEFKIASFVCVPLIEDGQWRFALCLYHSEPYDWREDEIALAVELTERIWTRLQRLRIEQALRVSEARFRVLFDRAPIAIYSCDAAGQIQEFNRCAVDLWGREPMQGSTAERFCGSLKLYLSDGTLLPHEQTPMAAVLKGEIPAAQDIDVVIERPDGSCISVIVNIVPLKNERGEISGAMNYFYDITERSRLEKKTREQAHELADQGRRKDEFLAMLGHELRNPLAPISNAIHLLRLRQNEDPIQIKACAIIERQLGQLTLLVDDLLEVSRITTGKIHLNEERLMLDKVVENAVETVRQLITQRRHVLALSMPAQAIWLYADAARLEQVLVNLLTNAAKYTDPGGYIWLSIEQQGDEAVLKVRDSGIGIAPELLPRVFDIFSQAERSLDRSQGGLGIGLSVVRRLVEMQRGTVEARSTLGQGSEFVVRLPAVPAVAALASTIAEKATQLTRSLRVLVVEDNVDSAETLSMLLRAYGHDVRMAHEGSASVQTALDYQPNVVLLDIGLPGMNGYEVAERLRQQPSLGNLVLVAMTGYGEALARQRSRAAGFDHHLVKPADFDKLQEILASVPAQAPDHLATSP